MNPQELIHFLIDHKAPQSMVGYVYELLERIHQAHVKIEELKARAQ